MILEQREYKREELLKLFNTSRLDAIKKKIQRAGYSFTESGRGNSYSLTVTAEPPPPLVFAEYCQREFGFSPQTDFDKLSQFMYLFLTVDNFPSLQLNEMIEELEARSIFISKPTVKKYCDTLLQAGFYCYPPQNYVYSVFDNTISHNKYITQEEYSSFWRCFFQKINEDTEEKGLALDNLLQDRNYGTPPKKRQAAALNGLNTAQYNRVLELIDQMRACGNAEPPSV